ncbi:MAG: phosphate regulon transcriptional regulator PhoB [Gammaproteobacteria bacterium]|jgi:two-component system phosphate regulon response regulator PhoB
MSRILVVDDDPDVREMIGLALARDGFEVCEAGDTTAAGEALVAGEVDLILLDWMLPGQSGFEFARSLRAGRPPRDTPVIMLTARDQEHEKVAALEAGADDYIAKPFSVSELLARIRAVLRRASGRENRDRLVAGGLQLEALSHRVSVDGAPMELAPLEFQLLHFLMRNRERVYSRKQLIDLVWRSNAYIEERTVDVHIRRLRKALEPSGHQHLIQTVRGMGYRFSTHD